MDRPVTLYDHITENNLKTYLLMLLFPIMLFVVVTIAFIFSVALFNNEQFTLDGIRYLLAIFPAKETYIQENNLVFWSGIGYSINFCVPTTIVALVWSYISFAYGDKMILSSCFAEEVKRVDNPKIYCMVENVAIAAGLPTPKLYIINDKSLNAFATGRDPRSASITLTSGIIEKLEPLELEAVIAHEMAHIGNRDIRLNMFIITGLSVFGFLADFLRRCAFSRSWGRSGKNDAYARVLFFIIMLALLLFNTIIAPMIFFAISRKREYLADATGALIVRNPLALASALEKISKDSRVENLDSQPRVAIACIVNPSFSRSFKELFSTHPSIKSRIYRLRQSAGRL